MQQRFVGLIMNSTHVYIFMTQTYFTRYHMPCGLRSRRLHFGKHTTLMKSTNNTQIRNEENKRNMFARG